MLDTKLLKKQLLALDATSNEFADLYEAMNEKYFTFDDPDDFQVSARVLNLILHRGEEWMIQAMAKIGQLLFDNQSGKTEAGQLTFQVSDSSKMVTVDVYSNSKTKEAMHKMFTNAVIVKAKEEQPKTES